mmetsp:Transcript_9219/g.20725  ORF Transcript_9219/g.20725 Transcript_9219/m.20725 type:complete len:92 (+) Transcript_9219:497-772(+)
MHWMDEGDATTCANMWISDKCQTDRLEMRRHPSPLASRTEQASCDCDIPGCDDAGKSNQDWGKRTLSDGRRAGVPRAHSADTSARVFMMMV